MHAISQCSARGGGTCMPYHSAKRGGDTRMPYHRAGRGGRYSHSISQCKARHSHAISQCKARGEILACHIPVHGKGRDTRMPYHSAGRGERGYSQAISQCKARAGCSYAILQRRARGEAPACHITVQGEGGDTPMSYHRARGGGGLPPHRSLPTAHGTACAL